MDKRTKTSRDGGNWIGVGTAIGVASLLQPMNLFGLQWVLL